MPLHKKQKDGLGYSSVLECLPRNRKMADGDSYLCNTQKHEGNSCGTYFGEVNDSFGSN